MGGACLRKAARSTMYLSNQVRGVQGTYAYLRGRVQLISGATPGTPPWTEEAVSTDVTGVPGQL